MSIIYGTKFDCVCLFCHIFWPVQIVPTWKIERKSPHNKMPFIYNYKRVFSHLHHQTILTVLNNMNTRNIVPDKIINPLTIIYN